MGQVKKIPMRKWVGGQEMKGKNGRGAYLCYSKECFLKAVKSKALERALKVSIPRETYENLEKEIDVIEGK